MNAREAAPRRNEPVADTYTHAQPGSGAGDPARRHYLSGSCLHLGRGPSIIAELRLSNLQMGYVFSTFAVAYGLFEIPSGWLGDRWGQRNMLTRIAASWSVFTALTGGIRNYWSLIAVRFAFGAAEAGAFPTLSRALARWFPAVDRGKVNGFMWMGARIGGRYRLHWTQC